LRILYVHHGCVTVETKWKKGRDRGRKRERERLSLWGRYELQSLCVCVLRIIIYRQGVFGFWLVLWFSRTKTMCSPFPLGWPTNRKSHHGAQSNGPQPGRGVTHRVGVSPGEYIPYIGPSQLITPIRVRACSPLPSHLTYHQRPEELWKIY